MEIDLKTLPSLGTAANLFPKLPTEALASDYAFATDGYFAGLISNAGFGSFAIAITDNYDAPDLRSVAAGAASLGESATPNMFMAPDPTDAGFGLLSTLAFTSYRSSLSDAPNGGTNYSGGMYTPWSGNSAQGVRGGLDDYPGTLGHPNIDNGRDTGDNLRTDLKRTYGTAKTPTSLLPPGTNRTTLEGDGTTPDALCPPVGTATRRSAQSVSSGGGSSTSTDTAALTNAQNRQDPGSGGSFDAAINTALLAKACFVAGTPILTPYGHQPIETLSIGDRVWARPQDQPDAPPRLQVVEKTFHRTSAIVRLHAPSG